MKFFLLSDNIDTQMGMRLAGVEGMVVHEENEIVSALANLCKNPEIGIILITHNLVSLCPNIVYDLKLNNKLPLIVEIPDRHSTYSAGDTVMSYIKEAIGIKL